MFNVASVLFCYFGGYACRYEPFCKKTMLFKNLFGKLQSCFCEGECAVSIFNKMAGFRKLLDCPAYGRLFTPNCFATSTQRT